MDRPEESSEERPPRRQDGGGNGIVEEKIRDMLSLLARFHGIDTVDGGSTVILDIYKGDKGDKGGIFFETSEGSLPSNGTRIIGVLVIGQSGCRSEGDISLEYFLLGKRDKLKTVKSAPLGGTTLIMGRIVPSSGSGDELEINGYSVTFDLCGSISGYLSIKMKKGADGKKKCGRMWILIPQEGESSQRRP